MIYHIEYLHISGPRNLTTESIWEFSQLLDGVMANRENSIETIKIWTEENKVITEQEIDKIILNRYGNYMCGSFRHLKELHAEIRESGGDERFLKFLQQLEQDNPKPTYISPIEFFNKINYI